MAFSFFRTRTPVPVALPADIHSHLLPGLDDGVANFAEAGDVIRRLQAIGYQKFWTTPHIMSDTYRNTSEGILGRLDELRIFLKQEQIDVKVEAAAEYYFDTDLLAQVAAEALLMTFGDRYLLFEMNYMNEPYQLNDFIFKLTTQGYRPVLAHPERYHFMTMAKAEDLKQRGVLFQINQLSYVNYYSRPVQVLAQQLTQQGWVDFVGSDCHHVRHADAMKACLKNKYFKKALELPLLNYQL